MPRSSRLTGIDLAYVISTIMCLVIGFFFVSGNRMHFLGHLHYFPAVDIFPAWFFFLNGMTLTLTMRDSKVSQRKLISFNTKRGTVLALVGLVFCFIWPLNVVFIAGFFYMLAAYIARYSNAIIRLFSALCFVLAVGFLSFMEVRASVVFTGFSLEGSGLKDLVSFVFFNGYYSVFPWIIFFLAGIIHGRGHVQVRGMLAPSNLLYVVWILLSLLVQSFCHGVFQDKEELFVGNYFPLNHKLFMPAFVVFGIGCCGLLSNACIYYLRKIEKGKFIQWIEETASLKWSMLTFQMILGAISISAFNPVFKTKWGIAGFIVINVLLIVWFVRFWKRKINVLGPTEWLMKRISSNNQK